MTAAGVLVAVVVDVVYHFLARITAIESVCCCVVVVFASMASKVSEIKVQERREGVNLLPIVRSEKEKENERGRRKKKK